MKGLECRLLTPEFAKDLGELFDICRENGDERFFYPHPLTREEAHCLAHYDGDDMYYVVLKDGQVIGYGLLRGWDEGYDIPTAGALIHPDHRGRGLGELLKRFMYAAAESRGAERILEHIESGNRPGICLSTKLGRELLFNGARWFGYAPLGKRSVADQIDSLIRAAIAKWYPGRADLDCEDVPDEEFIASETIGEIIEKMVILNIRIWHLVGKTLGLGSKEEYVKNQRQIAHCYKVKRPRLVVCLNRMLKALARGQFDLAEDWDVKDYGNT